MKYPATLPFISLFLLAASTPLPTPDSTHDDVSSPWTKPSDKFGPGHHGRAEQHEDVSSPWTRPSDKFGSGHHNKRAEEYEQILSSLIETAEPSTDPEDLPPPVRKTRPSYCATLPKNDLWADLRDQYYPECSEQPEEVSAPSDPEHLEHLNQAALFFTQEREDVLRFTEDVKRATERYFAQSLENDISLQDQEILRSIIAEYAEKYEDEARLPYYITCALPAPVDPWTDILANHHSNDASPPYHHDRIKQAEEQIAYWTRILTLKKSATAEQHPGFLSLSTMKLEFIGPAHPLSSQPESTVSYVMKGTLPGSSQNSLFILTADESGFSGKVGLGLGTATLVRVAEGDEEELGVDAREFLRREDGGEEWKSREVWEGLKKGVYWVMPEEKERDEGVTTSNPLAW